MKIHIAPKSKLDKILERGYITNQRTENVDLRAMLKEILVWANNFVPSESGSILLDDPHMHGTFPQKPTALYFVACFGKASSKLLETILPLELGIAGKTYASGTPYISRSVRKDKSHYPDIDRKLKYKSKSIVAAPIKIKGVTIGVIELINRLDNINYTNKDLTLLKIFAEYTSNLIQNSLNAKMYEDLSFTDNLTGLHNDRFFYDRLSKDLTRAIRKGGDISLVFLDLDRFKEVNDVYGHLAGSKVLTEVGTLIQDSLPRSSSKGIRYGGDEFVVLLPGFDLEKGADYAGKLRIALQDYTYLSKPLHKGAAPINLAGHITASIGLASLRRNVIVDGTVNEIRDALIRQADSAMYNSKESGRNRLTITSGKISPTQLTKAKAAS